MNKILLFLLLPLFCFAGAIGEDNNAFAVSLYTHLADKEENLAFSPYGIFSNLALLYFGAADATAQEIQNVLHINGQPEKFLTSFEAHMKGLTQETDQGYYLSIANALFPHKGTHFMTKFQEIASQAFHAHLQSVDYEIPKSALETINGWIDKETRGKIPSILDEGSIDKSTRMIVANAVYFQGDWVYPFQTGQGDFTTIGGETITTDLLCRTHTFPYFEDESLQCLALPFNRHGTQQPFLECLLVLPKNQTTLTAKTIDDILYKLETKKVDARIPKFCFSKKIDLNDVLESMGMKRAFTYEADFSKIDGMKDLYLNSVLHETYFSFHENGVTAAAATTSNIGVTAMEPSDEEAIRFYADHPFLFFIVDYHSRAILFMGQVENPTEGECKK